MRTGLLAIVTMTVAIYGNQAARSDLRPVGTWRLVAASARTADGRPVAAPFGSHPTGLVTYTRDGRMHAIVSHGARRPLSGDRISSPAEERAEAFATFFAYAGRYSVDGDRIIHHVEIASVQNWVGTDLIRTVQYNGDRLILRTPPLSVGGTVQTTELIWERIE